MPLSHNFAVGNAGAEKPTARPMIKSAMPSHTRLRETDSGSFKSNGGPEPNGGGAMMGAWNLNFMGIVGGEGGRQ